MTEGQTPQQLDDATIARLRDGSSIVADDISKREAWLAIAREYDDNNRATVLEAELAQLRRSL